MARLTVNEAGTSGYTDEIILTPNDFTTAAGNTTTVVNFPVEAGDTIDNCALVITEAFSVNVNMTIGPDSNVLSGGDADGFIENVATNATSTTVNSGDLLDDGGGANESKVVAAAAGNITITASGALDGATSGSMRVLFSVKRINF